MSRTGLMIPSAVSCATIYMSGTARVRNLGCVLSLLRQVMTYFRWLFLAFPVVFDCLIMLIAGLPPPPPLHSSSCPNSEGSLDPSLKISDLLVQASSSTTPLRRGNTPSRSDSSYGARDGAPSPSSPGRSRVAPRLPIGALSASDRIIPSN
eukprot:755851-Hanusia_phi.AAC.5